jgi:hypothetical protein
MILQFLMDATQLRYQILRPVNCYSAVFWIVTTCSLVEGYKHLEEKFCLLLKRKTASSYPPNCRCYSPVDTYCPLLATLFFIVQSRL